MVNSLLDFSRIEAGRIQAVYEPTDLATYTAELASTFRSTIERAGLRLEVDCPAVGEPVYVDREMWEKIVLNLLSNAFKYTFDGEIAVALRCSDQIVELEVRDSGIGIPPEEVPHLFERFHRVQGTRGRTQEGTGIGLALVRELVRLHGGEVTVESAPDNGSTFRVRMPTGSAHLPQDRISIRRTAPSTALRAAPYLEEAHRWVPSMSMAGGGVIAVDQPAVELPGQATPTLGGRILLADDNADMRDYVSRLLEQHYDVEAVGDGQAALDAALRRVPDLVLADVMMPRLDGFGLLRALREDERTRALPVVLLSARAGEEARIGGMTAGADDYLVKPFSARELLARVAAHLQIARLRRAAAQRERTLREEAERARAAAEDANKVKASFLATMSHELRTPLNAILGYADLLHAEIAGPLTSDHKKQIERVQMAARHLLRIIEEILRFSRIEAGREELWIEAVDLTALTLDTCKLVEPLAAQKQLQFDYDMPPGVHIYSDAGKVRQILLNLLSNAIKFTERGRVRLTFSERQGFVVFEIHDSGIGVAPDQQSRIFEPFHQVVQGGFRSQGGTGLGLSVSRELARLLGGEITLTSVPGQGSTFSVRVPTGAP
jgi:signal transduction histidine kinase